MRTFIDTQAMQNPCLCIIPVLSHVSQAETQVKSMVCFNVQILNVVFWIVPHGVILTDACSWFNVIINRVSSVGQSGTQ